LSEEKTTTLRLRRIAYKDGRTLNVLKSRKEQDQEFFATELPKIVQRVVDAHRRGESWGIAGFAFMVWSEDGASTSDARTDGHIPSILVPDFVRNKLLADRIEAWTVERING
jgi:hypothetical protein